MYRGRVGSGIAGKAGQRLLGVLGPLADRSVAVRGRGTQGRRGRHHWVRPEVVVEIARSGMTPAGRLRQPATAACAPTWRPTSLWVAEVPERGVMVEVDGRTLKISNLAKVMYPDSGTTKGEVLNYYAQVAPVLLPHLADRAVTRIRWPHGTGDMQFFEKNLPNGAPSLAALGDRPLDRLSRRRRPDHLPGHRGPRRPDLLRQPRLTRAARAPVDGRRRTGARRTRTGWSSTSTPARPPACGSAARWRCWCATSSTSADCPRAGHSGSKGLHMYAALPGDAQTPTRCATRPRRSPRSWPRSTPTSWCGR